MYKIALFLFFFIGFSVFIHAQQKDDQLNFALIEAAANGKTDTLIELLKKEVDIDFRDDNFGTALFYATQNNHIEIVKILVYNGAEMNYGLDNGFTPLMCAAYNGFFDIAEYLASHGASLDVRDDYWATALDYSIAIGDYYMVDMLLFYNANPHLLTFEKTSTLMIASLIGDTAIAALLVKKNVDVDKINKDGYSALSIAVQNNDTLMFDFLLANGASTEVLKIKNYASYSWALLNGNVYAYKKLKPEQASLQSTKNNRYNSLNIAYEIGDPELIKIIKKDGVRSSWAPFYKAITFQVFTAFNGDDAFFNFGVGLQDVKYKTDIKINYGSRFKEKAVLFQESQNSFTQLWEHRKYIELYVQKRFVWRMEYFNISIYAGLGAQIMFGTYDGTSKELNPSFALVPQVGVQIEMDVVYFIVGYDYTNYELYGISGSKAKLGLAYRLDFVKKPRKYSLLWM